MRYFKQRLFDKKIEQELSIKDGIMTVDDSVKRGQTPAFHYSFLRRARM